jgi:putative FmdB family regulatory protein
MPLYDYKCSKCGYIFEVQQRITEEPLKHCPKCKGVIKRLISPAGIIFKGSGFYVTDYKKGHVSPVTNHDSKSKKKKAEDKSTAAKNTEGKPKETKSSKGGSSPPKSE